MEKHLSSWIRATFVKAGTRFVIVSCAAASAYGVDNDQCQDLIRISEAYDADKDLSERLTDGSALRDCFYLEYFSISEERMEQCKRNSCAQLIGGECEHVSMVLGPTKTEAEAILSNCKVHSPN